MDDDLGQLLRRDRCALIVFECHEGVLGERSFLPGLAAAARDAGLVARIAALAECARESAVPVVYCTRRTPSDGSDDGSNLPLQRRLRARGGGQASGPDLGDIVAGLKPARTDVVVDRERGLTGFHETRLDDVLRRAAVQTVVLTGVSLNLGVLGTAIEAVNRGYCVVLPTDCVVADPAGYAESLLRHTLRNIAFLGTSDDVRAVWRAA